MSAAGGSTPYGGVTGVGYATGPTTQAAGDPNAATSMPPPAIPGTVTTSYSTTVTIASPTGAVVTTSTSMPTTSATAAAFAVSGWLLFLGIATVVAGLALLGALISGIVLLALCAKTLSEAARRATAIES